LVFIKSYYLTSKFKHITIYLIIKLSIVMKKLMSLLVAVALVAFMTSCATGETAQDQGADAQAQTEVQAEPAQAEPAQTEEVQMEEVQTEEVQTEEAQTEGE
jgi:hypothetical protein